MSVKLGSDQGIFTIPSAQLVVTSSLTPVRTHFKWSQAVEEAYSAQGERLVTAAAAFPAAPQDGPSSPSSISLHFSAQPSSPTPAASSEAAPTPDPALTTSGSAAGEASSAAAGVPASRPAAPD